MKTRLLAPSLLALAACSQMPGRQPSAAAGATAPPSAPVSFLQADLDGDARITRREFSLWLREPGQPAFDAVDTNRDGVITLDEWQAMLRPPGAAGR